MQYTYIEMLIHFFIIFSCVNLFHHLKCIYNDIRYDIYKNNRESMQVYHFSVIIVIGLIILLFA